METAKRKQIDRPFLGGLIPLFIAVFLIPILGHFPEYVMESVQEMHPEIPISAAQEATVNNVCCILTMVFTFAALGIHRLRFRRAGYKGCFTRNGLRDREVLLFVLAGVVLDVIVGFANAAMYSGEGSRFVVPTLTTVLLSCEAGIYEETSYRGIPVSIMMKNNPDYKRMWSAVLLTAVLFGLIHMINMTAGAGLAASIVQTVFALSIGLLMGAIYMRTGNILLTMVYHSLHDIIGMMDPSMSTGIMLQTSFSILDLALTGCECVLFIAAALFLLRKSKWEEIRAVWANIWAE